MSGQPGLGFHCQKQGGFRKWKRKEEKVISLGAELGSDLSSGRSEELLGVRLDLRTDYLLFDLILEKRTVSFYLLASVCSLVVVNRIFKLIEEALL